MIRHRAYRYRIYPTPEQEARILLWQHGLRFLWNLCHEQRLMALRRWEPRYTTYYDQTAELTVLRRECKWLAEIPYDVCAGVLRSLDLAWQRCFKKLSNEPRWKKKGRDSAVVSAVSDHARELLRLNGLHFPKLGTIRTIQHRPCVGRQLSATISNDCGQWFASIAVEQEVSDPTPRIGPVVAIDRGVVNAFADSDGGVVVNPRFAEHAARKLAHAQRAVSRRKKGSRNREKAKQRVAVIQRKVRRQRDHFLHVQSNRYANSHGVVVLESLGVQRMMKSAGGTVERPGRNVKAKSGLNRSIAGVGWSRFAGYLRYKLEATGGRIEEVPAAYSSQTCAVCAHASPENRKTQSEFVCVSCGHHENADVNAAKVLLSRRTDGVAVCGGLVLAGRPVKQKLRTAKSRRIANV